MQLCSTLCGTGRERSLGENWYTYMYGQGPSLFTWNCHIINQLYPNTKEKVQKKKKNWCVFDQEKQDSQR